MLVDRPIKLLHTADWHLGVRLGRHDRLCDQQQALEEILQIARVERPDLVIHAGDLFDTNRPAYEPLETAVDTLSQLSEIAPTIVVRGNHDSPALFRVIDRLAATANPRRLWMVNEPVVLNVSEFTPVPVAVACVPYVSPNTVSVYANEDEGSSRSDYSNEIRVLNDRLLYQANSVTGPTGSVIYAAHLHVNGVELGKSEQHPQMENAYTTQVKGLHKAKYCAFGHIHDPQVLPGRAVTGRYAGAIVPIDFGERIQQKQVVVVEIDQEVRIESRTISSGRQLIEINGTFEDLENQAAAGGLNDCILKARIHSKEPIPDLADKLLANSPRCVIFALFNVATNSMKRAIESETKQAVEPSIIDQFYEWRTGTSRGVSASHVEVTRFFAKAFAGDCDLGLNQLMSRVQQVLKALDSDATRN